MSLIPSVFLGLGLAAAAGFRVFLPLLALSIAAKTGYIPIDENWQWVGSNAALATLCIAGFVEIVAYYIPFIDNALDTIAVPLAAIAGTAAVAATAADMNPLLTWSLAIIAGGGTAGAIKSANSGARLMSSATTAGLGNPVVSTAETGASIAMATFAIFVPAFAILLTVILMYWVMKAIFKFWPSK